MQIPSRFTGARSKPYTVALSPRQTMNYAAGLNDANPAYFDDVRPGGILAPPMLAVALTWPLSADFDRWWGETGFPPEARAMQVHYNESIVWNRALRPDDSLTIQGEIAGMRPHPAGTLLAVRYDAADRTGAPVFTEHITGLLRGVALEDGGSGHAPTLEARPDALEPGWETVLPIDPLAAHRYDACADIVFPIHTSVAFARQVGLPGPIYQGTATLGLAAREILNREAEGNPAALAEIHAGFRGMVFPGTEITLRVHGRQLENARKTVYFDVETPDGAQAIRDARAVLREPG